MAFGTLFIVATPIGNLEDISARALRVLKEVSLILTEDMRVTHKLLEHYSISTPSLSYHQHSSENRRLEILKALIDGKNLALVTDAGTPGISDPGNELIDFLLDKEPLIKVISIPGPSAVAAALSLCGFDVAKYLFLGFFPKKKQSKLLENLLAVNWPFVYFDSPYRVIKNIDFLIANLGGQRRVFIGRELTKMHEESFRGSLQEIKEKLLSAHPKGEVVVVVEGAARGN